MPANVLDILRVGVKLTSSFGDDVMNVYGLRVEDLAATGGNDADIADAVGEWALQLYLQIDDHISSTVAYTSIDIHNHTQNTPLPLMPFPTLVGGGAVDARLPSGVCALVLGRTGANRVVGKKYLPPFTEAALVNGLWGATVLTAMDAFALAWRVEFVATNGIHLRAGIIGANGLDWHYISSTYSSPEPAYQRRRRPGRGS